jgi:hypothetical protein
MNNITLMIMEAGMASRYGGLKQLDAVGLLLSFRKMLVTQLSDLR